MARVATVVEKPKKQKPVKTVYVAKDFVRIPLEIMDKAPWNYKIEDADKAEKLAANIKRNGQLENIIVREMPNGRYEIVNGNHRRDAFDANGIFSPMVYNLGKISTRAAERIAVETNETVFDTDRIKLAEVITDIMEEFPKDDLIETMPFSYEELGSLAELGGFSEEGADAQVESGGKETDFTNPFQNGEMPVSKVLLSFGISVISSDDAELLSEAIVRARTELKIPGAVQDLTPAFVHIIKRYIESPTATAKKGKSK